jgi:hypothetical protein
LSGRRYYQEIVPLIQRLGGEEYGAIERAGRIVADAIGGGHRIWVSKTTHCLHDEANYRAGGLATAHVLDDPIAIEAGDAVLMGTNVGTTAYAVETASIARDRGAKVIVLTQLEYETSPLNPVLASQRKAVERAGRRGRRSRWIGRRRSDGACQNGGPNHAKRGRYRHGRDVDDLQRGNCPANRSREAADGDAEPAAARRDPAKRESCWPSIGARTSGIFP